MNPSFDQSKSLNCKTPIKLFSLIALVCTALSCITYFVTWSRVYVNGEYIYEYIIYFPSLFQILYLLAEIVPSILLVLYIVKFHKEFKAKIFMPIIFGTFVFQGLLIIVERGVYNYSSGIILYDMISYIIYLAQIITFSLATISALKGFPKKLFPIIATSVGLISEAYFLLYFFEDIPWYLENSLFLYLFTRPMEFVGFVSLFIALLLFVRNNKILPVIKTSPEKKNAEKTNPEQALRLLKDKLDLGIITQEEYQTQRADIIENL